MRSRWLVPAAVLLGVLLALPIGTATARLPAPQMAWGPGSTHIDHVVTVVMENRVYDNYFGTYCLRFGPYCSSTGNGIPPGTCVPDDPANRSGPCTVPFAFNSTQLQTNDMEHDWLSGRIAWNNGAMNGFYPAESSGTEPFGYYDGTTIPIYWDMAEQYAISDNLFAGNLSYSLPNHWDLVGGAAPNVSEYSYLGGSGDRGLYLNQSNGTATVEDLLNGTGVSWRYYDWGLWPYTQATHDLNVIGNGSTYNYWNPMAARAESYSSWYAAHFVPRNAFFTDARTGNLPAISWVIPNFNYSDHAPANLSDGEDWVAQVVDAVERSPDWSTTAVFIVWDDYGGWYDHVAPPHVFGDLLSFRSPAIVIGPYVKENYISHTFLDFFSLLRLVEWRFHLGCLTVLDCTAPLPLDFFNFNQTARSPWIFPTLATQARYPEPLQGGGQGPVVGPAPYGSVPLPDPTPHLVHDYRLIDPS